MQLSKPPERMLFGQFLLEQKKITGSDLALALYRQSKERYEHHTTRRLGDILLEKGIFSSSNDLLEWLEKFNEYNIEMLEIYNDAREIVVENRKHLVATGQLPETAEVDPSKMDGIDLGDVEVSELQSYVTTIDHFLEAAKNVSKEIRMRSIDKEGLIEIARHLGEVRQALISLTK